MDDAYIGGLHPGTYGAARRGRHLLWPPFR
jgi:hypothetical protein